MTYAVEVVITNKKQAKDPEGETIHRYLILKQGIDSIESVRSGKYLLFKVKARSPEEAVEVVRAVCEKYRIYNPTVHDIEVRLRAQSSDY